MSKILSKYANTTNLSLSSVTQDKNTDFLTPYTFAEWQSRNIGIIPTREYSQYNEYLKTWYKNHRSPADQQRDIRKQYIQLLREISMRFSNDPTVSSWLPYINLDDDWDLDTSIPFFARKLKDIAIYLANKRETVKKAKLKYNMVGSVGALEKLFYVYLLKAFSKKNQTIEVPLPSIWTALPELSSISSSFQLEIEELFDNQEYFDKDPKIPAKEYFTFDDNQTESYFQTKAFPASALDWLYSSGFAELCANNTLTWTASDTLATAGLSSYENYDSSKLNELNYFELANRYLGEKQWIATGGYYLPLTKIYTYDLKELNNWFYWPSGEYYGEAEINLSFDPIALSATNFTTLGTAGSSYRTSDILFIQKDTVTEGAWLAHIDYDTTNETMSAILPTGNKTTFKFPWPGYGLSAEDVEWTGKTMSNLDKTFDYLEDKYKQAIIKAYWESSDQIHLITPIPINDTTLVDMGATAGSNYKDADKIVIRLPDSDDRVHDEDPNGVYNSISKYAWLYKFTNTEIPIMSGSNLILWPFGRLDTTTVIPSANLPTSCTQVALSSLYTNASFLGSVAGNTLSASDIIFKLNALGNQVLEAAWLSGSSTATLNTTAISAGALYNGINQSGLAMRADPGSYTTFIWQNPDTTIDNVFKFHDHNKDCLYKVNNQVKRPLSRDIVDFNTEIGTFRWDYCTCRAFHYSPCGVSNLSSTDLYDYIVEDVNFPNSFDLTTWRDLSGRNYLNSPQFAYYKISGEDVGYSQGTWTTPATAIPFQLKQGHIYRYYRTNLKRDATTFSIPYFIAKYPYTSYLPVWIKASLSADNNWYSTDTQSNMILNSGDPLIYFHTSSSSALDLNTTKDNSINFIVNVPLSGWNYNTRSPATTALGARPYWAHASDNFEDTQGKGTPVYGGKINIVDEYSLVSQPIISNIVLDNDLYLEYQHLGESMFWIQPVELFTLVDKPQWNVLAFDSESIPLADLLVNPSKSLAISATNIPSSMLLQSSYNNKPVQINYYAQKAFTLTQELTDTTLGIPPTGGLWVTPTSAIYITPTEPYRHLTNRHYPTVANVPSLSKLYSVKDVGGYFLPKSLGISVYLGRNYSIGWDK